jgi:hypothetical protein
MSGSPVAKAPISSHPAFPAIVALWFAALLGLGSMVLPVALIERLVSVTRIGAVIPAAEPPLGFTARAAIALAASIAGSLGGLSLARKVARSSAPEPRARSFEIGGERQCRPISAHEELGDDGLDSSPPTPLPLMQKRRSLAMAEDNRPSAYLQAVPLPGQSVDDKAGWPPSAETAAADPAPVAEADSEPLELATFAMPEEEMSDEPVDVELDDGLEELRRSIHTAGDADAEVPSMAEPTTQPAAFEPDRAHVDPLPFAAPSLRRSLAPAFDEEEQADMPDEFEAAEALDEQDFADEPAPQLAIVDHDGEPADDDRPAEELGLVQLAARLGASIEKRRARLAERQAAIQAPPPPLTPFGSAEDFEAAQAEDAARAIADFFGPAQAADTLATEEAEPARRPEESEVADVGPREGIPAPLRGVSFDEEDDEDDDALAASFSLPLGTSALEAPLTEIDGDDFDEEGDDGEYSSLLEMKNPFARQQEFVRIEEPVDDSGSFEPAVTFPSAVPAPGAGSGEDPLPEAATRPFDPPKTPIESALRPAPTASPRDPGDAERSLRDALATLQRMSGAA